MRDIGKNIKELRIRAKLTQEELAEKLFVTRQTVSNYENGKSRPDVDMIVRIGEVLNADANTVIYGIPEEMDKRDNIFHLYQILDKVLTPREQKVLILRYGLYGREACTQQDIADLLGISRSYISRIEKNAVEKLRKCFS